MNKTKFVIRGRAHSMKLNNLIMKGFKPNNVQSLNKRLIFEEESRNEKRLQAALDELCYDYEIIGRRGPKHTAINLICNQGLFIGLIVSLILLIACTFFVFDINIIGAEKTEKELIYNILKESGVRKFGLIYTIDKRAVAENVLAIEGISSASVETRGVKVYVYIKEELDKPDLIDYTKPVPVISDYDAIVTRVVVLTGTAAVKNGDTVLKGQTLIYPYLTNKKENEETEEIRVDIRATGMVYGRVWYKESFVLSDETIITKRTGKYKEYVTPSYIFKGGHRADIPYERYETEQKTVYFNAVFPLKVTYTRYYELEDYVVKTDIIKQKDLLVSEAYIRLSSRIPDDAQTLRFWTNVKEVDNLTYIDVYLETEQRIDSGGEFG